MGDYFYNISCIFFLYGSLGWCVEVIYAAVNHGKFINRGFLFGPICPIYGIGMLAVLLALKPLQDNLFFLYVGSVVITSLIELVLGFLSEKLFHERLWDYSENPFNLKGYICLKFSLLWGLGAVVIVDILHPMIWRLVNAIPVLAGRISLGILYALLAADLTVTVIEALKIPRRIRALSDMERLLSVLSNEIGGSIADSTLKMRDRKEELEEKIARYRKLFDERTRSLTDRRLAKAFPRLEKGRYRERFEHIRDQYFARKDLKNDNEGISKDA